YEADGWGDVCLDVVDRLQSDRVSAQLTSFNRFIAEGVHDFFSAREGGPPHSRKVRWQICYGGVNDGSAKVAIMSRRAAANLRSGRRDGGLIVVSVPGA